MECHTILESSGVALSMTQKSKGSKDSFFVQPSLYVGPLDTHFSKIGGYIKNLLGPGERPPLRLSKMVRHLYF